MSGYGTNIYDLVGGPLDGERVRLEVPALRISIPYSCEDGCCNWGETYDAGLDGLPDRLYYIGRMETEYEYGPEDRYDDVEFVPGLAEFMTEHNVKQEQIADLEAMFLSGSDYDEEGDYDYD